jgi:hypothetical protein
MLALFAFIRMNRFAKAGQELLKLNIGNAVKSLLPQSDSTVVVDPADYRGSDPTFFWSDNFRHEQAFTYGGHDSSLKAYQKCPPLTAVINRKAQAYINGKTWVMNTRGKEATSKEADKIRKLLAKPNPLQSWRQFEAQQQIYIQLFGFCIVFPIIPAGFDKYGPVEATSLWNIPPYMLTIKESNKIFYQTDQSGIIDSITLVYRNQKTTLPMKSLYIFKDITPSFNTLIFPESRVCALEMPINNIIGALESRNVLINYRGALGAFTRELPTGQYTDIPMTPTEQKDLQSDFARYGLKNKQWKFIITNAALKWQQIGIATKDLMLFEEIDSDTMMICDQYGYPYRLLANNSSNSLGGSDVKQYKQLLYQDTIIPEADSCYEQWNNMFRTEEFNIRLEKTYTHLPILQEDEKDKATARYTRNQALLIEFQNNLIPLNRWLELNEEDTLTTPEGKMYYYQLVAQGWKFGSSGATQNNNNGQQGQNPGQQEGQAQSGQQGAGTGESGQG